MPWFVPNESDNFGSPPVISTLPASVVPDGCGDISISPRTLRDRFCHPGYKVEVVGLRYVISGNEHEVLPPLLSDKEKLLDRVIVVSYLVVVISE
jgi:hypothetical protein